MAYDVIILYPAFTRGAVRDGAVAISSSNGSVEDLESIADIRGKKLEKVDVFLASKILWDW